MGAWNDAIYTQERFKSVPVFNRHSFEHVRVVHAVVENVEREGSGDDAISDSRWEKNVGQLGERCFENKEEQRGHDKP